MRRLLLALLAGCAFTVHAEVTVRVQQSVAIDIDGATAAYAIDPSLVDVSIAGAGHVTLTGRSAGTTQLIAVTAFGTKTFSITIGAAAGTSVTPVPAGKEPNGRYEVRYASDNAQLRSSFDVFRRDGERQSQVHVLNVRYLGQRFHSSSTAFPSIFYRVVTPHRTFVILDDFVDASPLTVHGTQVRGIHLLDHALEIHAGYAAATMYEDLFLPADHRWVAGAGYGIDRGGIRWTPSLYVFFSSPKQTTARRGVVASLAAEYRRTDVLWLRGELGASRVPAAAADLRYDTARDHLSSRLAYKPEDFPTLGLSDLPGTHGEVEWTRRHGPRVITETFGAYDDYRLQALRERFFNGSAAVRFAVTTRVTITSGAGLTDLRTPARSIRTISIPAGIAYDRPSFGASLSGRILDNDGASRRGDVVRASARAAHGAFNTRLWVERQRQAPTLDLIFREEPGLAQALARLGIAVHSPEEMARILRDNAALINLGYIEGVTVNLTPLRWQAGFDATWMGAGEGRDQLRFHALADRNESVGTIRTAVIGSLAYSRRVFSQTDLFGSLSLWRGGARPFEQSGKSVELGLRQHFDGLPAMLRRRFAIEGVTFLDPEMNGSAAGAATVAGIIVTLDGTRSVRSDERGAYAFANVAAGSHFVMAQLPASRPSFFTTASRVDVSGAAHVDFGMVWSSARVNGRVISDSGAGIPGVTLVAVAANDVRITTKTDGDGAYELALPAGSYTITLLPETLPLDYSVEETNRRVVLEADRPQTVPFAATALRGVSGIATGASEVVIEPLGTRVATDAAGNFAFRSLPAGHFTLTALSNGRVVTQDVTLPPGPATLRDVTLNRITALPTQPVKKAVGALVALDTTGAPDRFAVQAGAFRDAANARRLMTRLATLGELPFMDQSADILFVRTGPFPSRSAARASTERLRIAGIDAYVIAR